jgi:NitT/TauT family transport system substrate-binding protein
MRLLAVLLSLLAFPAWSQTVWRHGVVEAKADSGIVFMPLQHDFAASQGLSIQFVQFKGDAMALKALLAGDLDSYESSPGGAIIAASRGADVRIAGCYWPGMTYGIFATHGITSVTGLADKTFAISGPGSLPDLLARAALAQNNMPVTSVHVAVLGSDADRFRALSQGIVDAAAFSTEFVGLAQKQGMTLIFNAAEQLPNYVRFCTFMGPTTLHDRADLAARFLAAEMQGWRYALSHQEEAIALSNTMTHAKPDDTRAQELFHQVATYHAVDPSMPLPMDRLAWIQNLLVQTGNLKAPYDLSRLVDGSARQQAQARLASAKSGD